MNRADTKVHYDVECFKGIPISSVVAKFKTLKRVGERQVTECPWHDDHHPSLTIYETNTENRCHCFACGNGGDTISYVMQQAGLDFLSACAWLAREFNCGIIEGKAQIVRVNLKPKQMQTDKAIKEYTYIPMQIVDDMVSYDSSFVKCMMKLFDPYHVQHLVDEYKLGIYDSGNFCDDVTFPSIDEKGRVHNIKAQNYCTDRESPEFFHCAKNHYLWLGKSLAEKGLLSKDAVFDNDCMFGAHLLPKYPSLPIVLVESPKNAIICAMVMTDCVCIATGNKGMLRKANVLRCLKGRDVMVFPDRDAIEEWKTTLNTPQMKALANFAVSDLAEKAAPTDQPKYDIADYILQHIEP